MLKFFDILVLSNNTRDLILTLVNNYLVHYAYNTQPDF